MNLCDLDDSKIIATYSSSQNPMRQSATNGSSNHFLIVSRPSCVVAACATSGMLWYISLRTFLSCSGIGAFTEQYGSNVNLGSFLVVVATDLRAATICLWNPKRVDCRAETEDSGMMGISNVESRLVYVSREPEIPKYTTL